VSRKKDKRSKHRQATPAAAPGPLDLPISELVGIVERTRTTVLNAEEHAKLAAAISTLQFLITEIQAKQASLGRLRQLLFGARTEKTRDVLAEDANTLAAQSAESGEAGQPQERPRPPGHGRHAAAAYTGAEKVAVPHPTLQGGDTCPGCAQGRVYPSKPSQLVRITGVAPLGARVYSCDRLRCNLCGEIYTASPPAGVGDQKYDATATSMVGLLKYGTGVPFNRIEKLQEGMGIPLPASTQWDLVQAAAQAMAPAHEGLIDQAAQGKVVYNDDTTMKILQLTRQQRAAALADDADQSRTGVFTSGIVSTVEGKQIALFFTGVRHAGENLAAVLAHRAADLPAPIQMCDGLSSNTAGDFETVLSSCLLHSRRKYVEVAESFPEEVRFVLETLREVYRTDARTRDMTAQRRLELHQQESGPRMEVLAKWMQQQFDERKVEPNSTLGDAIHYMQGRWEELTLFLRIPGAPLDSNIVERALKKAILHRKNALFYKTLNGARVGDIFMSLIYTAEINGVAAFDYLVALQLHAGEVAKNPGNWTPWNYQAVLERRNAGPGPPV